MSWLDPIYWKTAVIVLSTIFISGGVVFFFRDKNYYFISAWASIKSWLFAAPVLFLLFAIPPPGPLIVLTLFAIYGAKAFFQILGMYHRHYFVLICYAGIYGLAACSYYDRVDLYNQMPVWLLGLCCLVPLFLNSYDQMIQYISLTLLGFIFLGWSFMHLALLLKFPSGLYQILYLVTLTEFCDNTNVATSYYLRGPKIFSQIDPKRTYASSAASMALTIALAGLMRFLLPDNAEKYWLVAGLVASIGGLFGDVTMTALRKDAGVKDVGPFILGRGDFLQRMDRLIFVAPIYFYVMNYVESLH
ncbi:MAG TPA: phosphatidate cytidylyltransferase [Bdellovibrionota bacterium]|jgi:phosphatidate cytidylyltransferase